MVPIIILIVVILLLRAMATSKTAANVTQVTKTVCSAPTAGDSFTQGNTIAVGVPEPPLRPIGPARPVIHCCHITVGQFCGLPAHVVYPIAPPPIKIMQPAPTFPKPAPMPVAPIARPVTYLSSSGHQIPVLHTLSCGSQIITSGGLTARRVVSGKAGCQGCFLGVRCL